MNSAPLWVQGDRTVLVEVDHESADPVQRFLPRFAELEKSPERFHTYRITPLSLWNAAAIGVSADEIIEFLTRWSRHAPPANVLHDIRDFLGRYGLLRLVRRDGTGLVIESKDAGLLKDLHQSGVLSRLVRGVDGDGALSVDEAVRGDVKVALLKLGYPVEDLAGYAPGAAYPFRLRAAAGGGDFVLRHYQQRAAELFHLGGGERGGSGVIVLPCGAGKTIVAMAVMEKVQAATLILTTNTVAVHQWRAELLDKSETPAEDIGEYTGMRKEIRPITVSTYQIMTHRRSRMEPAFTHFGLFSARDWGLIIYDEVHLLPAPVFRATAELQARRRLGLTATLVREDQHEDDVFSLIGPKRFDMPWKELESQGWIATARCIEVRVPMPPELRLPYLSLPPRDQFRVASENPQKLEVLRRILDRHRGSHVLVIGQYLGQLEEISRQLGAPLITGKTPVGEREVLYADFRAGRIPVLVVSKVGNFAIDLPDANVAIQVSGTFGSRQEEAQRLGRILRPKKGGMPADFYSLITRDSKEVEYGEKRQRYLTERGYSYRIIGPPDVSVPEGRGFPPKDPASHANTDDPSTRPVS